MKTFGIVVLLMIFSGSNGKILIEPPEDATDFSFLSSEGDPKDYLQDEDSDYETSPYEEDPTKILHDDKFLLETHSQDVETEQKQQQQHETQVKEDSKITANSVFEETNASSETTGVTNTSAIVAKEFKDRVERIDDSEEVSGGISLKKKMLLKENNSAKLSKVISSQNILNNQRIEHKQTKSDNVDGRNSTQKERRLKEGRLKEGRLKEGRLKEGRLKEGRLKEGKNAQHSWTDILRNIESMMPVLSSMISSGKSWMPNSLLKEKGEESPQNMKERSDKIVPVKMFHPLRSLLPSHAHSALMPPLQTDLLSHTTDMPVAIAPSNKQQQAPRKKRGRSWPMFQSNTQTKPVNSFSFQSSIPAFLNSLPFLSSHKTKASRKRSSIVPSRIHLPNYPLHESRPTISNSHQNNFTNLVYYASLPDSTLTSMEHHLAIVEVPMHAEGKIPLTSVHVIAPGSTASKGAKENSLPFIPTEKKATDETPYVMVNSVGERNTANVDPYLVIPYKDPEAYFANTEIKKIMLPLRRAPQVISDLKNSFNNLRMESSEISTTYVKRGSHELSTAEGFGPPKSDDVLKQQQIFNNVPKEVVNKPYKTTLAEYYVPSASYGSQTSTQKQSKRNKQQQNRNKQTDQVYKETNRIPTYNYETPKSPPVMAQHGTSVEINKIPVNADSGSTDNGKHKHNSLENNTKLPSIESMKVRLSNTKGEMHQTINKDQKENTKHIGSQSAPQAVYLHPTQATSAHNSSVAATLAKYWFMLQENLPDPSDVINYIPNPIELLEKSRSQLIKTFNKGMVEIPNFFEGVLEDIGSVLKIQNEIPSEPGQPGTLSNSDGEGNRYKRKPFVWSQGIQGATRGQIKPQKPTKFLKQVDENEDYDSDSLLASQQWTPTHNKIRYSEQSHRGVTTQNKHSQQLHKNNDLKMSVPLVHEQMVHTFNTKNTPITEMKAPPAIGIIQEGHLEYSSNAIFNDNGGSFEAAKISRPRHQIDKIPPPSHRGSAAVRGNFLNEATNEQQTLNINTLINDPITAQVQHHNYVAHHRPSYAGPTLVMFSLENAIPLVPANPSFDPIDTSASEQLFAEATGTQQRFYKIQLNNSTEKQNIVPQRLATLANLGSPYGYTTPITTTPATRKNLANTFPSTSSSHTPPNTFQRLPTITFAPTRFHNQQSNSRYPVTTQSGRPPISYNQQPAFGHTNKPVRQWTPPSVDMQQQKFTERYKDYKIEDSDQSGANSEISTEALENENENALLDIEKNSEYSSQGQLEHYNNNQVPQNQYQSAHQTNHEYITQSPYYSQTGNVNDYQTNRPRYKKKRQRFRQENKQQTTNPPIAFFQNQFNSLLQPITIHNQTSTAATNNKNVETSNPNKLSRYPTQTNRRPTTSSYHESSEKLTSLNNFMWMNKTNKEKHQAKPLLSPFGFNFSNPTPTPSQIRKINKRPRSRDVAEVFSSNWPSFNIKEPKVSIEEPKAIEVDIDTYVDDDQLGEFSEVSEVKWKQPWRPKKFNLNEERVSSTTTKAAEEELVTVMAELLELQSEVSDKQEVPFNPIQERSMRTRSNNNNLLRYRRPQNSKVDNLNTDDEQDQTPATKPSSLLSQMAYKANINVTKENGRTPLDFLSRMRNRKRTSPMPEYKATTTFSPTENSINDATRLSTTNKPSMAINNINTSINIHSLQIKPSKSPLMHNFKTPVTLKSQPTATKALWQPTFTHDEKKTLLESNAQSQMSQRKPVQSILLQDAPKPNDNFGWEFSKMTLETTNKPTDSHNKNKEIDHRKNLQEDSKLNRLSFNAENKQNYDKEFSFTSRQKQVQNSMAKINNKNNDTTSSDNSYNLLDINKENDQKFEESISFPTPRKIWKETRSPDVLMYHRHNPEVIKTPSYTSINVASGKSTKR